MTRSTILLASLVFLTATLHAENTKLAELKAQSSKLAEEIFTVVKDPHSADPELKRLQKERIEAARAYHEAAAADPNLKQIREELDASMEEYNDVMKVDPERAGGFERLNAVRDQHLAVALRYREAIENQPGLTSFVEADREANEAYNTRFRQFFLNHPANKDKVAQLNKIDAEIEKLEAESAR